MSKKSHQKRAAKRKAYRPGTHASQGAPGSAEGEPDASAFDIPDEVLKAPKEVSKLKFGLMVLLVIFLLLIFSIPSYDIFGGGGRVENVALRWDHPGTGTIEYTSREFAVEKQAFGNVLTIDPLAGFTIGLGQRPSEDELVRLIILDRLAADAGIVITQQEVANHFSGLMSFNQGLTTDAIRRGVASMGMTMSAFDETLRRLLRVGRYLTWMGSAGALADPAKIEEFWNDTHAEFAFDYVQLEPDSLAEEARGGMPPSGELQAWFDAQPDSERLKLESPARREFEMAMFRSVEATPATGLIEAFPVPEGEEIAPEELASDYYNRVFYRRFGKPKPETTEGEEGDEPAVIAPGYFSEEEVADQLQAEAPAYFAMQRWLENLQERKAADEEIDFLAEAEGFGLELYSPAEPLTREELEAEEFLTEDPGKNDLLMSAFQTPVGSFGFSTVLLGDTIGVIRVVEEVAPMLPAFEEIESQVADLWIEPRTEELAEEKLQALWESFETFEPEVDEEDEFAPVDDREHRRASEEAFRTAAEAAGFTVQRRDWLDRGASPDTDPDWQEPANRFIANQREFFDLEPDEIAPPKTSLDGVATYLVRLVGERPVSISKMTPAEYERFRNQARAQASNEVSESLDFEHFQKAFSVELPLREAAQEAEEVEAETAE